MGAMILIFAFLMSLVINFIEKMISHRDDGVSTRNEAETSFATEQSE